MSEMTEIERRCLARLVAMSDTPAEDFDEHEHSVLSEIVRAVLAEAGVTEMREAIEALLRSHKAGVGQCCKAADMGIAALAKAKP